MTVLPLLASGNTFSFAYPWVLLALLTLPLLALLRGKIGGTPGILFSSTKLVVAVGKRRRSRRRCQARRRPCPARRGERLDWSA